MLKQIKSVFFKLVGLGNPAPHARPEPYGTGQSGTTKGNVITSRPSGTSKQRQGDHPETPSMPQAPEGASRPGTDQPTGGKPTTTPTSQPAEGIDGLLGGPKGRPRDFGTGDGSQGGK